jgi:transposase
MMKTYPFKKKKQYRIPDSEKQQIINMFLQGIEPKQIAEKVGWGYTAVILIVRPYREKVGLTLINNDKPAPHERMEMFDHSQFNNWIAY